MYLGIDVGSVSTDAVLIDELDNIIAYSVVKSGFNHKEAIEQSTKNVLSKSNITKDKIKKIVGTGYGRRNVPDTCKVVTEISCHAMGMHCLNSNIRTIIDIGGQDSKIIRLSENGYSENFIMNDKCSAGTGRFLEVMANAMDIKVEDLGSLSLSSEKAIPISSICTVFAESEVISRIAEGIPKREIVAGIHKAISNRIIGMARSVGIQYPVALAGGVAMNEGLTNAIARHLDEKPFIPETPQVVGAYGAAIFAKNNI